MTAVILPDLDAIQARADAATEGPWDRPLNLRARAAAVRGEG